MDTPAIISQSDYDEQGVTTIVSVAGRIPANQKAQRQ